MAPVSQSRARRDRPLGTSRDWRRRLLLHHAPLALASAVVLVVLVALPPFIAGGHPGLPRRISTSRLTTATGYLALGLLGMTLLVGPANLLLRRRNPVSSSLRRDFGTWTAIFSVVHVVLGFQLHGRGLAGLLGYFVADGRPLTNGFGLGNWTGLGALLIVAGLLALSTDASLRELKARRWKRLQRLNYALFALVVLHALFYGALSRATSPFTLLLLGTVAAVLLAWLGRTHGSGDNVADPLGRAPLRVQRAGALGEPAELAAELLQLGDAALHRGGVA
jgi:sulfoxide reductase heme-binding subunit YedZ